MAELRGQADKFGTNHFQLYENQADVQKLVENSDKKSLRTELYEN